MKLITFRREVTISDLVILATVGVIMATDHYRIGRLEEEGKKLSASVEQTNVNVQRMADSCHETAWAVAQLVHSKDTTPPVRY